jgi:hypothetical protein
MNIKKLWPLPVAVAAVIVGGVAIAAMQPPGDLDYSLSHASDNGLYTVTIAPGIEPIPVGRLHAWTVAATLPDGTPAKAEVMFDGGMPRHGHGLPTVPKTLGEDDDGRAIIGGVRFNMPGWWELKVHLDGIAGEDTATFNIAL